ncbi:putative periplasmic lipoprotein [Perlucidibaca piscinae]|uniref:lipocalin family protein n=1 Tax=Perlucidibaca piscinae TaxID=392589 RepID=UPI0003B693B0|nr:lipocalin family protein [Perlucidibaca piscinae]
MALSIHLHEPKHTMRHTLVLGLTALALATSACATPKASVSMAASTQKTIVSANDLAWRQAILGTWQAVESPESTTPHGEATFTADGNATGYTTATYVYNDGQTSDVKVKIRFKWRIENGVVIMDQFVSDPASFVSPTQVRRFEIEAMNEKGAIFRDLADGEKVYRRKVS